MRASKHNYGPSGGAPRDESMSEYGRESMWRDTAKAGSERARDLAARLERRANAVDEVAARDAYLDLLGAPMSCSAGMLILPPVSWTLQIARKCGRSVPWPSASGERSRTSSRPRRCG